MAVICDDGDPSNLCPAAGTRLETTLTVGPNPGDDLEPLDLCSLHNGCLEIYVEFDNGADLALDVVGGPKDPPAGLDCSAPCATPIPAVSAWGLAGLCIALAAAAAAVIVRRNRRAAHNA